MKKINNKRLALKFTAIYVGLGILYSCFFWSKMEVPLIYDSEFFMYVFAPVSFIPVMILYSEKEPVLIILLYEIIVFFILWALSFGIISIFRPSE